MEKSGILAQSTTLIDRIKQHRWTIGVAGAASALGMAGAIAVAPADGLPGTRMVVEQLALESAKPVVGSDHVFLREEKIQRGDTVAALLNRLGIQEGEALYFVRTSAQTQALYQQLVPGKVVVAQTTASGDLVALHFPLNGGESALSVERVGGALSAKTVPLRFETHTVMKTAEIRSSLFAATDGAGIPDNVAIQMAEIFGGEIDFHRDLRKGDRFSVVFEMNYLRGQPARSGRILAAEFTNNGKTHRALWFDQEGKGAYYTAEGKSLRKAFLRSPLEFSRVTSGFALRFHPILQQWRAHKGVDYGAPSGTRVRATGDGQIEFAGSQGGYGNVVIIRHSGSHSTAYGHLKGFASGIRKGSRVNQGDTIGYVGQTGWATGPHLHYEFRINNQQVNPLAVNLPTAIPLEGAALARFKTQSAPLLTHLTLLGTANLAALD